MKILSCALIISAILVSGAAHAQTPPAAPAKPSAPVPARPPVPPLPPVPVAPPAPAKPNAEERAPAPLLFNIRVDVAVTEEGGGEPLLRKEVSVTVGDGRSGSVRSGATGTGDKFADARLRVDVQPRVDVNGKIRTLVTLSYLSFPHFSREGEQRFEVLLDNGKLLTVSQASSAISDRRLRVDVTATILK